MEKKVQIEKLFKITNELLFILSSLGFLTITFLHIVAPFFLFYFYLIYIFILRSKIFYKKNY